MKKNFKSYWIRWAVTPLLIIFGTLLFLRNSCSKSTEPDIYDEAWNDVVILRAYLDGVQDTLTNNRLWVGIKNVGLHPVAESKIEGSTYEASEVIIAEDWKKFIFSHVLMPELLNRAEMTATLLYAMRCGKYGFEASDFLADINSGNKKKALQDITVLHKSDGSRRTLGREATQYLWVVQKIFAGEFTAKQAIDLPMFSYKKLNPETATLEDLLKAQNGMKTPRQALGL